MSKAIRKSLTLLVPDNISENAKLRVVQVMTWAIGAVVILAPLRCKAVHSAIVIKFVNGARSRSSQLHNLSTPMAIVKSNVHQALKQSQFATINQGK